MGVATASGISLGILVLRIAVGGVMLAHGYNHIFRGGKIKGTAGWFESLGMKPGVLHAWLASITELAAGAMLVVGFLQPLAGAGVVGVMLVAWITNHRTNGFFIFRPGEGWEYVMTLTACGLTLASLPAGRFSLDHLLDITWLGWKGLGTAAVLGGGGALLLLAVFWRPQPKPQES